MSDPSTEATGSRRASPIPPRLSPFEKAVCLIDRARDALQRALDGLGDGTNPQWDYVDRQLTAASDAAFKGEILSMKQWWLHRQDAATDEANAAISDLLDHLPDAAPSADEAKGGQS